MKTNRKKLLTVALASSLLFAGCYGNFSLVRKLYEFNGNVGDKWMNSIATWVMAGLQIYTLAGIVDLAVLNVIEFWTGSNPATLGEDKVETQIVQKDGKIYQLAASKNRMEVLVFEGGKFRSEALLTYSKKRKTWSVETKDKHIALARVKDNNTMELIGPEGGIWIYDLPTGKVVQN